MIEKTTKLFNRNFFLFWQGQTVSRIGSQIYFMAMMLWVKDATDSATLMGLLGMVAGIPAILFSTIGGTFADRFSRKNIIVGSDIINGIVVFTLAVIFFYTDSNKNVIVPTLFVVATISGIVGSFFTPAMSACLPDLVPENRLTAANSFTQLAAKASTIFGWIVSGILYEKVGMPVLILINSATFIFGAISKYVIKIPRIRVKHKNTEGKLKNFFEELKEGFRFVLRTEGLRKLVFISLFMGFFMTPITLLLLFYVSDVLMAKEIWYSYLLTSSLVGGIVGSLLASILNLDPKIRGSLLVTIMFLNASSILLLSFNTLLYGAVAILFFNGFAVGFVQVYITTIMQLSAPQEIRGRVFGFISTLTKALIPLGMGLAGIIADLTDQNIPLIYKISGSILVAITLYVLTSGEIKKFLAFKISTGEKKITPEFEHGIVLSSGGIKHEIKNQKK